MPGAELAVEPEPGDLVVIHDPGTYAALLRERLQPEALLAAQRMPTWE